MVDAGGRDIERAARSLASKLPAGLAPLAAIAYNYSLVVAARRGPACSRRSTPIAGQLAGTTRCGCCRRRRPSRCARAAADDGLCAARRGARATARASRPRPPRTAGPTAERPVAFFCAEYARPRLAADLLRRPRRAGRRHPQGGLRPGAAAGRRRPALPPGLLPPAHRRRGLAARVLGRRPTPTACPPRWSPATTASRSPSRVPIGGDDVVAQIWRVDVGRVPLYLLDAERPENGHLDRWTTLAPLRRRPGHAPGAVRRCSASAACARCEALGIEPGVVHLNEGHAAFARSSSRAAAAGGAGLDDALAAARARTVFTTHTPVPPATTPTPPTRSPTPSAASPTSSASTPRRSCASAARTPTTTHEPFGVTQFALRTSRARQRASAAATARSRARCGTALWPDRPVDEVPIGHVTNGVHVPTWVGAADARAARPPPRRGLAARAPPTPRRGRRVDAIPDEELWAARRRQRAGARRLRPRAQRRATGSRAASRATTSRPPPARSTPTC